MNHASWSMDHHCTQHPRIQRSRELNACHQPGQQGVVMYGQQNATILPGASQIGKQFQRSQVVAYLERKECEERMRSQMS
jgi:hypothetical protein